MEKLTNEFAPGCTVAKYHPQTLPQYVGNPFIEALPPTRPAKDFLDGLLVLPPFTDEQRFWSDSERLQMLQTLGQFVVPLQRHFELAGTLDRMLRAGYVGRLPNTASYIERFNKYEYGRSSQMTVHDALGRNPQLSALLMGVPGVGKTTAVKQFFRSFPKVIWHPEHHVYQVPVLFVEMPSDGASVKGLVHGILLALDRLIPGANYYQTYAKKGVTGADVLMRSV